MEVPCLHSDIANMMASDHESQAAKFLRMVEDYGPSEEQLPNNQRRLTFECQAVEAGCRSTLTLKAFTHLVVEVEKIARFQSCQGVPVKLRK